MGFPVGELVSGVVDPSGSQSMNYDVSTDSDLLSNLFESSTASSVNPSGGSNSIALQKYADLARNNPEYMDSYLQALAERENTLQAQQWYSSMANSQYSRAMEDIKKAGYNPYLVLNGLNGAGSGSVSAAGTSSISGYQNKLSKIDTSTSIFRAIASAVGIGIAIAAVLG